MSDLFLIMATKQGWFQDIINSLFAGLDWIIFKVVQVLFKTIFNIANFELDIFAELIMERVYVILGIFMLFKVTISFITYLVNPDKISDKEQGVSKVVVRIILVLVMLIGVPTFFDLMTEFQNKLLPVIPRIILVTEASSDNSDVATKMTNTLLQGFVSNVCEGDSSLIAIDSLIEDINDECGDTGTYKYDYSYLVSTLVGAAMCYVLVSMCINVAIRAFKLIILKAIAPVPIMSYVDPKSSKDGAFSRWTKTLLSTWAELFIHMAIIYFIIELIAFITEPQFWTTFFGEISATSNGSLEAILLLSFLIIGLLFFAKSAPKFIFDALGIKTTGSFTKMLGMGATAFNGLGTTAAVTGAALKKGTNPLSAVAKGLFSGGGAMVAGGNALLSSDKATLTTGMDQAKKYKAQSMNNTRAGYSMGQKLLSGAKSVFGYDIDAEINNRQAIVDTSDKLMGYAMGEGAKKYSDIGQKIGSKNKTTGDYEFKDDKGNSFVNFEISRDQFLSAVSQARVKGTNVTFNGADFGSVDGSMVTKITGDLNEGVGDLFLEKVGSNYSLDSGGALKSLRTSYANAKGISMAAAEAQVVTTKNGKEGSIKVDKKSNETAVFNLKQEKGPKN